MGRFSGMLRSLGPGLLWAGAAIGVSHLVQSTRAGATYGFALVGLVLLANLFKYPFFEFGPRYAASTGKTLLSGYLGLGRWAFGLYLVLTFLTMFTIQAAVTMVTSGLVLWATGSSLSPQLMSAVIMVCCLGILAVGKYALLDKLVKAIIVLLTATTLVAVAVAFSQWPAEQLAAGVAARPPLWEAGSIVFMVALMGWMPSAIDISVWSSIWTTEKRKLDPEATTLKAALFDFNVGYLGTAAIALAFLSLGALVMFGSGTEFSASGAVFAGQLIELYTTKIGAWSLWLVATAALATMFSTTLTCLDAYGRVLSRSWSLVRHGDEDKPQGYFVGAGVVIVGAVVLISVFSESMKLMVDIATILSFLTAPILAVLNYRVVTSSEVPADARPKAWLRWLSWAGIAFLGGFSLLFVWVRLTA